jgi:hypothetical protein
MSEGLRALVGVPLLLLPPGLAIAAFAGRGLRPVERMLIGWAVSPLALGLPALALVTLLRHPLAAAVTQTEFVCVIFAVWGLVAARGDRTAEANAPPVSRVAPWLAIAALVLTAIPPLASPFLRMWSDAWFHAAAAIEIQLRGIPPQDPNFAGIPLYYPWFFHTWLALIGDTLQVSPFHAQAMLDVWSAGLLVFAAGFLAPRLPGSPPAGVTGAVVLLGVNPLGWIHWILAGMVGATRGWASIRAGLAGPGAVGEALSYNFSPSLSSLLDRVWIGTALTPAIALALTLAWCVDDALRRPGASAAVRVGLVAATMEALHPAFASVTIALVALALVVTALGASRRGAYVRVAIALGVAVAVAIPYVRLCSLPDETTPVRVGVYVSNVWALAVGIGPWWIPALAVLPAFWRAGGGLRVLTIATTGATLTALFLILPERNTEKFFYLVWVWVALFAVAGGWSLLRRFRVSPALAGAALVLVALPSTLVYTVGCLSETRSPGILVRGSSPGTDSLPLATPAESVAYHYLASGTPVRAIVLDGRRPTVNEPMPVLAGRRVFCGSLDVYLTNHFGGVFPRGSRAAALMEEVGVRRGIEQRLRSLDTLGVAQHAYLDTFQDPLVLVLRRTEVTDAVWRTPPDRDRWSLEFANDAMRIYRYRGAAAGLSSSRATRDGGRRPARS